MSTTFSQATPTIRHKSVTLLSNNLTTTLPTLQPNLTEHGKLVTFSIPEDLLLPEPYSQSVINTFFAVFTIIIVLSIIGNVLVISVFVKSRRSKTVTDIYIISLAVSDLLIATLNMPFQLYFTVANQWMSGGKTGESLCKFTNYVQGLTVVCSILTLLAIAIDRYVVICRAKISHRIHRQRTAIVAVVCVWVISMSVVVPHLIYQKLQLRLKVTKQNGLFLFDGVRYICVEEFPSYPVVNAQRIYSLMQYIICYLIPVIIMAFTYGKIGHRLWIHQPIGDILENPRNHFHNITQKKRIIRMLMILFLSFVLLWFPFFTFVLYSEFVSIDKTYRVKLTSFKLIGYSTCCVNPIIYTFLNKAFRQELYKIFCRKTTKVIHITVQRRTNETSNSRY